MTHTYLLALIRLFANIFPLGCVLLSSLTASDRVLFYFNEPSPNPIPATGLSPALTHSHQIPTNRCGLAVHGILGGLLGAPEPKRMDVLMYSFTDGDLISRTLASARHGMEIRMIIHRGNFTAAQDIYTAIRNHNHDAPPQPHPYKRIHVRTLTGPSMGNMHHKVLLINFPGRRKELVTGSYNFTNNAAKQSYENCIRFRHSAHAGVGDPAPQPVPQIEAVIDGYQAEFERLWGLATELPENEFTFAPPPVYGPDLPPGGIAALGGEH